MVRKIRFLLMCGLLLAATMTLYAAETGSVVRVVEIRGAVTPVTRVAVERAVEEAAENLDDLILIVIDTPGGMVTSMEAIVQAILGSKVPVVVWVGPAGAKAASAGFFILMAADVAAMAPGTHTGAASVVVLGGENRDDDILLRKANKDAGALIRSLAERRNRNVEACEKAVADADAFTDKYALDNGLIELVAGSREELMELLDGREITRLDGTAESLTTAGPEFVESSFSMKQALMEFLASPIVAYALLLLGLAGIIIEFTHPGLIVPGVLGGLFLVLFAISASLLPISLLGLALIALAIVLFVLEVKIVSYGLLTMGGVVCLVFGSAFLVDGPIPELRVPWPVILPMSLTMAALVGAAVFMTRQAMRTRVQTGVEGLVGEIGVVSETLSPEGRILVHGEIWNAVCGSGEAAVGTRVRIVRVDEMTLFVEPRQGATPRGTAGEV